jgi:hypothetical protein
MLAHTFLAVTAHKTKKGGADRENNQASQTIHPASRPNRKPRHRSTDV